MQYKAPLDLTNLVAETGNNIEQLAQNGLLNDSMRQQIEQLLPPLPNLSQIGGFNKELHYLRGGKVGNDHVLLLSGAEKDTVLVVDTNQEVITLKNSDVAPTLQFFEIAPRGIQSKYASTHGSSNHPDSLTGSQIQECPTGCVLISDDNEVCIKSTTDAWNSTQNGVVKEKDMQNNGKTYSVLKWPDTQSA